jgi:hypothetical protein
MLVEIKVSADVPVAELADPLLHFLRDLSRMGASTNVVLPDPRQPELDLVRVNVPPIEEPAPEQAEAEPVEPPPAKRVTRQRNGSAKAAPAPAPELEVVPDLDADPFADETPTTSAGTERSDAEKKNRALGLLRHVWARGPGGADAVKKLQKTRGLTRFDDVPLTEAGVLLSEAERLATIFKVSLPG